jgi:hypothetical protein
LIDNLKNNSVDLYELLKLAAENNSYRIIYLLSSKYNIDITIDNNYLIIYIIEKGYLESFKTILYLKPELKTLMDELINSVIDKNLHNEVTSFLINLKPLII